MPEWIRVDTDILDHKKTILLSRELGESELTTTGRMIGLFSFTQINAWRDGDLAIWGESGIERAARWQGEPGKFFKAANTARYLDGHKIHNWEQYAAKYVQRRIQRERQKSDRGASKGRQVSDKKATPVTYRTVAYRCVSSPCFRFSMLLGVWGAAR